MGKKCPAGLIECFHYHSFENKDHKGYCKAVSGKVLNLDEYPVQNCAFPKLARPRIVMGCRKCGPGVEAISFPTKAGSVDFCANCFLNTLANFVPRLIPLVIEPESNDKVIKGEFKRE